MVSRSFWIVAVLVFVFTMTLAPGALVAQQEHGGQEHGGATTAAPAATGEQGIEVSVPEQPAAPPAPAPAALVTPPAPPALKPIVITFSGDLASVNTQAAPAMITVQDRYGVKKEIEVPAGAKIAQGTAAKALADLKVGDKLTVEYTYDVATGKRSAQSITVGEAAPSA